MGLSLVIKHKQLWMVCVIFPRLKYVGLIFVLNCFCSVTRLVPSFRLSLMLIWLCHGKSRLSSSAVSQQFRFSCTLAFFALFRPASVFHTFPSLHCSALYFFLSLMFPVVLLPCLVLPGLTLFWPAFPLTALFCVTLHYPVSPALVLFLILTVTRLNIGL